MEPFPDNAKGVKNQELDRPGKLKEKLLLLSC